MLKRNIVISQQKHYILLSCYVRKNHGFFVNMFRNIFLPRNMYVKLHYGTSMAIIKI